MEEKLLYTSNENLDIIQVEGILEENNIPYVKKENGTGQYMNIAMGTSFQEQSLYVNEEKYEEAAKLIQDFSDQNERNETDIEMEEDLKKAKLLRNILIYGFIIAPTLILLLIVVLACLGLI